MTSREIRHVMVLMCELKKVCALVEAGQYHEAEKLMCDCQRMIMELRKPEYFDIWNM